MIKNNPGPANLLNLPSLRTTTLSHCLAIRKDQAKTIANRPKKAAPNPEPVNRKTYIANPANRMKDRTARPFDLGPLTRIQSSAKFKRLLVSSLFLFAL